MNDDSAPLYVAAQTGHQDVFGILLKSGAAIDGRYCRKQTVLHTACFNIHHKMVKRILSHDKRIAMVNRKGNNFDRT